MALKRGKRKRNADIDTARTPTLTVDITSEKKSKIPKKATESTLVESVSTETTSEAIYRPGKSKRAAMPEDIAEKVAAYVAVHASDTPEEARKRRLEARKRLNITGTYSNAKLGEMLAMRDKEDELRMLRMYEILPLERSLKSEGLRIGTPSQEETEKEIEAAETSEEDEDNNSIFGDLEARSRAQLSSIRRPRSPVVANSYMTDIHVTGAENAFAAGRILPSAKLLTPTALANSESVVRVDLLVQQEESMRNDSMSSPKADIHTTALSSNVPDQSVIPVAAKHNETHTLEHASDNDTTTKAGSAISARHIYIESNYFTAIMGENGMKSQVMERETNTNISFSPWDELNLVRCDITGHPEATAEVKTRILCAVVDLRHRHLVNERFIPKDVCIPETTFSTTRTESCDHLQEFIHSTSFDTRKPPLILPDPTLAAHTLTEISPSRNKPPSQSQEDFGRCLSKIAVPEPQSTSESHKSPPRTGSCQELTTTTTEAVTAVRQIPPLLSFEADIAPRASPKVPATELSNPAAVATAYRSMPESRTATNGKSISREQSTSVQSTPLQSLQDGEIVHDDEPQPSVTTKPTEPAGQAEFVLPENAIVIKIEDDPYEPTMPSSASLHIGQSPTSSAPMPVSDVVPLTTTEILPLHLDQDLEAVLNHRRSRIQTLEHECTKWKFMLRYLGVSDVQMELLQQKFDGPRNANWDESCGTVLGCARKGLRD